MAPPKRRVQKPVEQRQSRAPRAGLYALKDVCTLTGAKRSSVEHWVRSQVVQPQFGTSGTGNYRLFSFANLVELAVCEVLNRTGASLRSMQDAVDALSRPDPSDDPLLGPEQQDVWKRIEADRIQRFGQAHVDRERAEVEANLQARQRAREAEWTTGFGFDAAAAAQEDAARLEAWRRFKRPDSREDLSYHLLRWPLESAGSVTHVWTVETDRDVAARLTRSAEVFVINLRLIFERLEAATQDRCGAASPASRSTRSGIRWRP